MQEHPHLVVVPGAEPAADSAAGQDGSAPLAWLVRRMSQMSVRKGDDRRVAVFKWFAAVATTQSVETVTQFLPLMIDRCQDLLALNVILTILTCAVLVLSMLIRMFSSYRTYGKRPLAYSCL